jgi:hypothetical protein
VNEKLLSLQEAMVRIVEDETLCMMPWVGGYMAFRYLKTSHEVLAVDDGRYRTELTLRNPDMVFSYWRVESIKDYREKRDRQYFDGHGEVKLVDGSEIQ